jgi:hypothetical protein
MRQSRRRHDLQIAARVFKTEEDRGHCGNEIRNPHTAFRI